MSPAFPKVTKIRYEGPRSKNPLAFKYYNAGEMVEGRTMKDQLRFSVVYWHTFRGTGWRTRSARGRAIRPWDDGTESVANAQKRARVAFEFIEKLGAPFYACMTAMSRRRERRWRNRTRTWTRWRKC